ncbi:MAG: sulfate adenylyltransferase [Gammaproteobacteria bacterium]|nr:sulfate adenylyltransferase [Gammaproteobacteria bacterium]MBT8149891.1 sulfate adenylyltransferase [Gammaproteobacteria bacterium]NND39854.1 sulfate adenylyltransferase [Pseudomonadales bacterium]NNM12157.1 sulfate adenylyltransferase [Pseudomonadales bacterium]RZV49413.1 MAG: sulfate adenylyltransferase [Pseudomonadales bacterium]
MIKPHGANQLKPLYVEDDSARAALLSEAEKLPSVVVSSAAATNAVMLGGGYFTPLEGYMNVADAVSVAETMHTSAGLFWPVPIMNLLESDENLKVGERIALRDPNVEGNPVLAVMHVEAIETLNDTQRDSIIDKVYGTQDEAHPGVAAFKAQGNVAVSGPIKVLNFSYFTTDFPGTFRTAVQIREEMSKLGWEKIVAFQTRNPMHRAHEELCRMAMQDLDADGCLVHMLLGKLKPGDIPADVRDASIRKMVELYFEPNTVLVTGYGFDMLYAGPREAVLHAVFRQNCGCTHLIVGRDHAGVGDYYGAFDAQEIFDAQVPDDALLIDIYRADHTAYSKKLDKVVMMKDAPDHSKEDFVLLSGTAVREMLGKGIAPPPEFSRPEVAQILMDYYQSL